MSICVIVSTVDVNDCIFCVNEQQKVYYLRTLLFSVARALASYRCVLNRCVALYSKRCTHFRHPTDEQLQHR